MVGAPVSEPMFLFSLSTTVTAMEKAEPSARFTPLGLPDLLDERGGQGGGLAVDGLLVALPGALRADRDVRGGDGVKSLSKVVFIVSVKTSVPQTNATESSTATAERAMRPLVREEVAQGGLPDGHDVRPRASKCFMRSRTWSAVGSYISSTMEPSAR